MARLNRKAACRRPARGLSTLEMVMVLPILLFVMALMINFGTATAWKVRSLCVARDAVWRTQWPRTGQNDPAPEYWQPPATMSTENAGNIDVLDDPLLDHPVVRGPLPQGLDPRRWLLDPSRGLRRGKSYLERPYALLAKMGGFTFDVGHDLLDDCWQYQRMGLHGTVQRRIPTLYVLAKAGSGHVRAYLAAVGTIVVALDDPDLAPLDRDEESIAYGNRFGWGCHYARDFHPYMNGFCQLPTDSVGDLLDDYVDKVEGEYEVDEQGHVIRDVPSVPEEMAGWFIGLFERVIQTLRYEIDSLPPPANRTPEQNAVASGNAAEIAALERRIERLQQFLQTLKRPHGVDHFDRDQT